MSDLNPIWRKPLSNQAPIHGRLLSSPEVGRALVILFEGCYSRATTSPVMRILADEDGRTLYVETNNSIYRVDTQNGAIEALDSWARFQRDS